MTGIDKNITKRTQQENGSDLIPNNPDLVDELIDNAQMMDPEEFDRKYSSLNSSDMCKVAAATITMDYFMLDDRFGSRFDEDFEDIDGFDEYDDEYDEEYDDYDKK